MSEHDLSRRDFVETAGAITGAAVIGEIGITGTADAISNAVFHATGIRVRDLPITLDKPHSLSKSI